MAGEFDPVSYILGQRSVDPNAEYYTKAEADVLLNQKQNNLKCVTETIDTSTNTATIDYDGSFINAFAMQGGNLIQCDIIINYDSVVFVLQNNPTSEVVCTVWYS